MTQHIEIAGKRTTKDWETLLPRLNTGFDPKAWAEAYDDFFMARLTTRYFQPIRAIKKIKSNKGAGFSVVTLHCSMMEFLQAIREGAIYEFGKSEDGFYHDSGKMVSNFLLKNKPFSDWVPNKKEATEIYKCVRCALFHEARTRSPWKIRLSRHKDAPKSPVPIDCENKIIYRDKLDGAMKTYLKNYRRELLDSSGSSKLRENFIHCFDHFCKS